MATIVQDTATLVAVCTVAEGEQFQYSFDLTDKSSAGVITTTDLTSALITWVLKASPEKSDTAIITKTEAVPATEIEIVSPAASSGKVLLWIRLTDFASLTPGVTYYHEMWAHLTDGRIKHVIASGSTITFGERTLATLP